MTMRNIFALMAIVMMAAFVTACDEGDDCVEDENGDCVDGDADGDTDSDTDSDTDTDTDSDTDSDTDTDTDTETDDPTACDCLKTEDPDNGCYDIEGDWYIVNYSHIPDHLLTIILTVSGDECKVESTGAATFYYALFGTELPLETYNAEDDQHVKIYRNDTVSTAVLHVNFWGANLQTMKTITNANQFLVHKPHRKNILPRPI